MFCIFSFAGPFAAASPQESLSSKKKELAKVSSSDDLFASMEEVRLQVGQAVFVKYTYHFVCAFVDCQRVSL